MTIENAINYALRIIKPVLEGKASVAEVKREAEEAYVKEIHKELDNMVWATGGCNSWYKMGSGATGQKKGWNGMTYPWWSGHYWYRCLFPAWKDWEYSVSECEQCHCVLMLINTCREHLPTQLLSRSRDYPCGLQHPSR